MSVPDLTLCLRCLAGVHACSAPMTCSCEQCNHGDDMRSDAEEWDAAEVAALIDGWAS